MDMSSRRRKRSQPFSWDKSVLCHRRPTKNARRVVLMTAANGLWYLDTGVSSHMTGEKKAFANLDEAVHGTVRFDDGSVVSIHGRGTVAFCYLTDDQHVLSNVYHIPSLCNNIVSLGQLNENGCKIVIEDGMFCILDHACKVLA